MVQERRAAHDTPGTYEGQTALHIAIVNRDFDMVKFLVQVGESVWTRVGGRGQCIPVADTLGWAAWVAFTACTAFKVVSEALGGWVCDVMRPW